MDALSRLARKVRARDGDGDGLINDGTPAERPAPLVVPGVPRQVSTRGVFAKGSVKDPLEGPWSYATPRIWPNMTPEYWATLPVETIDPTGIRATQNHLLTKHLNRYRADPEAIDADKVGVPWVIEYQAKRYVVDGHHRVAVALEQHRRIKVRINHVS